MANLKMLTLCVVLNLLIAIIASVPFNTNYAESPAAAWTEEVRPAPAKRRLVVRVPFAQNPDSIQLSRIYKSLFTQPKQKKLNTYKFALRSLLD
ncbi:unnamed protein product [Bursaphelenchus okinawaensis]|uniref:Uncharacterized protein n=1 Tax=Bursaphelenchus okinawaensis TaxID=465554 RepID=A0A811K5K1_9BILA|nr:unnamed protein product [Bursaphelenchus okinawaensis]CAG9091201.1 unnamed protein product [Bursaphelenchus okinawaensis]